MEQIHTYIYIYIYQCLLLLIQSVDVGDGHLDAEQIGKFSWVRLSRREIKDRYPLNRMQQCREKPFVPYRDSTLTRILQTSLSGNARIWVICTINPTKNSKDESLNTMRFARNAKLIKTTAKLTKVP